MSQREETVVTVSTLLESPATVERWVERNLAGGADHMIVFLDQPSKAGQAEVWEMLREHPHVTPVRATERWWGTRPANLNKRQAITANIALEAVRRTPEVAWLFHIDGDEVLDISDDALVGIPHSEDAVLLEVLESTAEFDGVEWGTSFKRTPSEDELVLLASLGVIRRPTLGAMISGHTLGKGGVRPGSRLGLGIHAPMDPAHHEVTTPWTAPGLRVLHHYSSSGQDMVDKARRYVEAGPVTMGKPKEKLIRSVQALEALSLDPGTRDKWRRELFDRLVGDDVEALRELGFVVEVPEGAHVPNGLSAASLSALASALQGLAGADKEPYNPWASDAIHDGAVSFSSKDAGGGRPVPEMKVPVSPVPESPVPTPGGARRMLGRLRGRN